jgi:hypothetical protein
MRQIYTSSSFGTEFQTPNRNSLLEYPIRKTNWRQIPVNGNLEYIPGFYPRNVLIFCYRHALNNDMLKFFDSQRFGHLQPYIDKMFVDCWITLKVYFTKQVERWICENLCYINIHGIEEHKQHPEIFNFVEYISH